MKKILKNTLTVTLVAMPLFSLEVGAYNPEDRLRDRIDTLSRKIQNKVYRSNVSVRELRQVKRKLRDSLDILRYGQGGGGGRQSCAVMYEHSHYTGRALPMNPGDSIDNFADLRGWNDVVSAVKVSRGCTLTVYQHSRYRGWSQTYNYNTPNVGGYDDQFSSASCVCY